jgi:hypothetical protein
MNCGVNVIGKFMLTFYIFKGERLQQDYIKDCKPGTCMAMQKKGLHDNLFVQGVFKFFQKVNSWWDLFNQSSPTNFGWPWIPCYSTRNRAKLISLA